MWRFIPPQGQDCEVLPILRYGLFFDIKKAQAKVDKLNENIPENDRSFYYVDRADIKDAPDFSDWADVLSFWEDEVKDYAERYDNAYPMYEKYNKIIDGLYDLTQGVIK